MFKEIINKIFDKKNSDKECIEQHKELSVEEEYQAKEMLKAGIDAGKIKVVTMDYDNLKADFLDFSCYGIKK